MSNFKTEAGDWTRFRALKPMEVDFHHPEGSRDVPHHEAMAAVETRVLESLREAQRSGKPWVLFTHGHSTSGAFKTSARSVVREVIRSKKATPLVVRADCIQHESVFLAKIRQEVPHRAAGGSV